MIDPIYKENPISLISRSMIVRDLDLGDKVWKKGLDYDF